MDGCSFEDRTRILTSGQSIDYHLMTITRNLDNSGLNGLNDGERPWLTERRIKAYAGILLDDGFVKRFDIAKSYRHL